jgi:hypothetical protein
MSHPDSVVRITILVKRKESLPLDEFHQGLLHHAARYAMPWLLKTGVYGYTQIHIKPELQSKFAALLGGVGGKTGSIPMLEYDAVIAVQFRQCDLHKLEVGLSDPFFVNEMLPAEAELFAEKGSFSAGWEDGANMLVGVEHNLIKNGQVVSSD